MLIQDSVAPGHETELVIRNMSMFRLSSVELAGSCMISMTFNLALPTSTLSHVSLGFEANMGCLAS